MRSFNRLLQLLLREQAPPMIIERETLWHKLLDSREKTKIHWGIFPWNSIVGLLAAICSLLVGITLVLVATITLIKDDILYQPRQSSNQQGCLRIWQGAGREYGLYLFNTSDLWADTGIELSEGDRFRISYSGDFHSSAGHLVAEAQNNTPTPTVNWSFHSKKKLSDSQSKKHDFCLDKETEIGTILFRIAPVRSWKDKVIQINELPYQMTDDYKAKVRRHVFKKVKDSKGTLQLAINDVYFEDTSQLDTFAIKNPYRFVNARCESCGQWIIPSKVDEKMKAFIPEWFVSEKDSSLIKNNNFDVKSILNLDPSFFKENYHRMMYDDNLGQVLVCVEVRHPLKLGFINPLLASRNLGDWISATRVKHSSTLGVFLISLFWFFVFVGWMSFIFLFWFILVLGLLYLLYTLFYWVIGKRMEDKPEKM